MPTTLAEDEPAAGPWRVAPLSELVAVLLDAGVPALARVTCHPADTRILTKVVNRPN